MADSGKQLGGTVHVLGLYQVFISGLNEKVNSLHSCYFRIFTTRGV